MMKTAIVTGAFGFAGANLVEELLENGFKFIRPSGELCEAFLAERIIIEFEE